MAQGIRAEVAAAEFLQFSDPEARHADLFAWRIFSSAASPIHPRRSQRALLEGFLVTEEEHADDLAGLLGGMRS